MVAWSFEPLLWDFSKIRIVVCLKNHKKSKLCNKVIIFLSLERSCVTLRYECRVFFFFPFYCRVILIFVKSV